MTIGRYSSWYNVCAFVVSTCCFLRFESGAVECVPSTGHFIVNSEDSARSFAETVNCSNGQFGVDWIGSVQVPTVTEVPHGTVVNITGGGGSSSAVVDGAQTKQLFIISGGVLNLDTVSLYRGKSNQNGGAIYAENSTITMTNCTIMGNSAEDSGGALYFNDSTLIIMGVSTFEGNVATRGGVLFAIRSRVTLLREYGSTSSDNIGVVDAGTRRYCTVIGNEAKYGVGGGFYLEYSVLDVWGLTRFEGNVASFFGGALLSESSNITVFGEIIFSHNSVMTSPPGSGGGAETRDSTFTVPGKVTFFNNSAYIGGGLSSRSNGIGFNVSGEATFKANKASLGGALGINSGRIYLDGSTRFSDNIVTSNGGAIEVLNDGGIDVLGEVTFVNNSAEGDGGGIAFSEGSSLTFNNSSTANFTANTAGDFGGAIAVVFSGSISGNGVLGFVGNSAGDSGGAVYVRSSNEVYLCRGSGVCSFFDNNAVNNGGAIYAIDVASLHMKRGIFGSNRARIGAAAALYASTGYLETSFEGDLSLNPGEVTSCAFLDNIAIERGGGLDLGSGEMSLADLLFERNTAGTTGGALSTSVEIGKFDNCTFRMNGAPSGPAVTNNGVVQSSENLEFDGNTLVCDQKEFIDYTEPINSVGSRNYSSQRYEAMCVSCIPWASCTGCSVLSDNRVPTCVAILDHTSSLEPTGTLETLSLDSGYWRTSNTSRNILTCYRETACAGGSTVEEYCSSGYEGPYCAVCQEDYSPGLDFSCSKCSTTSGIARVATSGVLLVSFFVLVFILVNLVSLGPTSDEASNSTSISVLRRLKGTVRLHSLKTIIVVWQIITQFSSVAGTVYPRAYERFLAIVNFANLDLASILSVGCIFRANFYFRLFISTLGPLAVSVVLACTYTVATLRSRGNRGRAAVIWKRHTSIALLVAFLVYPQVSSTAFSMFVCDDLDDGHSYLRADYSIRCDTDYHRRLQMFAAFMVLVYPVGIPLVLGNILVANRIALGKPESRDEDPNLKLFGDMWRPYRPEMYLYEMVAYLRRILLTGIVVFIYPNTATQIAVTILIELFFFLLSAFLVPHQQRFDSWLSHLGHVVVFVSFFLALLLKVDVSDERDFNQQTFAVVLILVHCFMIIFVFAEALLLAWQMEMENITRGQNRRIHEITAPGPVRMAPSYSFACAYPVFLESEDSDEEAKIAGRKGLTHDTMSELPSFTAATRNLSKPPPAYELTRAQN